MTNVNVVIGPGSIGQAIARRVSTGKHVVLADLRKENAEAAAKVMSDAGFDVSATTVDISSRRPVIVPRVGPEGGFITGSDFLMDGGVTAAYWYGEVEEVREK